LGEIDRIDAMDFGDILKQWENRKKQRTNRGAMESWLEKYSPGEHIREKREANEAHRNVVAAERRRRLRALRPQRQLDLHGLSVSEAAERLDTFLRECHKDGLKKVLIIHGKGKHSKKEPVLARAIRGYVQKSPYAGEHGAAGKNFGGNGAIWVILR
jgi:DNA-nicking Smr family endonuclease